MDDIAVKTRVRTRTKVIVGVAALGIAAAAAAGFIFNLKPAKPHLIVITNPVPGTTLSGAIGLSAKTGGKMAKLDFILSNLSWPGTGAPAVYDAPSQTWNAKLNTAVMPDGKYDLVAVAYTADGAQVKSAVMPVLVKNGNAPVPPGYNPPGYVPPGYQPPGYNPPGYNPPGYVPPGNSQPQIIITNPLSGATLSGVVTLSAVTSVKMAKLDFYLSNAGWPGTGAPAVYDGLTNTWSAKLDTTVNPPDGSYDLIAVGYTSTGVQVKSIVAKVEVKNQISR